ncbi:hypothetical protein GEMRC1_011828 [Eukaryota sp. GEM-RC1]
MSVFPEDNSVVFAQVVRVNRRSVHLTILGSESGPFPDKYPAVLRQRDVRSFNPDAVDMYKSFQPTDIIRARIISLGDARAFYLSTSSDDLGVILCFSEAGHVMIPLNFEEMQCSVTKVMENRKVAHPLIT